MLSIITFCKKKLVLQNGYSSKIFVLFFFSIWFDFAMRASSAGVVSAFSLLTSSGTEATRPSWTSRPDRSRGSSSSSSSTFNKTSFWKSKTYLSTIWFRGKKIVKSFISRESRRKSEILRFSLLHIFRSCWIWSSRVLFYKISLFRNFKQSTHNKTLFSVWS